MNNEKAILIFGILILLFANVSANDFLIRNSSDSSQNFFGVYNDDYFGRIGLDETDPDYVLDFNGDMCVGGNAYYPSSANLGKFQHSFASRDYVDKKDTSTVYNGNLELVDTDDQGNYYFDVWGDGDFIYLADYTYGMKSYSRNLDGELTLIDSDSSGNAVLDIWGDGNFIYVAYGGDGIYSFLVDEDGYFHFLDSHDPGAIAQGVWGDGNFVYLAGETDGVVSYSVNSTGGFTFLDSYDPGRYAQDVWGDGNFIYVANEQLGLYVHSVDENGDFTPLGSYDTGSANSVWGDGNFIYLADTDSGLHSYSVNSTGGLTHIDSDNQGDTYLDVWGDGEYIYTACYTGGIRSYSVNSTGGLNFIDSDDKGGYYRGVWGDENFIYATNSSSTLLVYKKSPAYEYDKANQSHYFDDHVGIGIDDPSENLVVADNMMAYNDDEDGTYIGFFKGEGSLPGYATDNYPTIKSDHNIYFAPTETYVAAFTPSGYYQPSVSSVGGNPMCWDGGGGSYFGDCSSLTELKKDISNLSVSENLWEKYMKLQPVNYRWKDTGWEQNLQTGFLAEQVASVDPLLASYSGYYNETINENLSGLSGVNFYAIKTENVLMLQDLKKENEMLKKEICLRDDSYSWCDNKKIRLDELKNKMNQFFSKGGLK